MIEISVCQHYGRYTYIEFINRLSSEELLIDNLYHQYNYKTTYIIITINVN